MHAAARAASLVDNGDMLMDAGFADDIGESLPRLYLVKSRKIPSQFVLPVCSKIPKGVCNRCTVRYIKTPDHFPIANYPVVSAAIARLSASAVVPEVREVM